MISGLFGAVATAIRPAHPTAHVAITTSFGTNIASATCTTVRPGRLAGSRRDERQSGNIPAASIHHGDDRGGAGSPSWPCSRWRMATVIQGREQQPASSEQAGVVRHPLGGKIEF